MLRASRSSPELCTVDSTPSTNEADSSNPSGCEALHDIESGILSSGQRGSNSLPADVVASSRCGQTSSSDITTSNEVGTVQPHPAEVDQQAGKAVADRPKPPRDWVLDNTKFFLTMCVVGTHTTGVFVGERHFSTWFHDAMFVLMMPTYVFISGYCSSPDFSRIKKVDGVIKVAAIYFLAELFWLLVVFYGGPLTNTTFFGWVIHGASAQFTHEPQPGGRLWKAEDWMMPYWQLWYLLFLVFWRLMLPFWWRLKFPLVSAWLFGAIFVGFKFNPTYAAPGVVYFLDVDGILGWFPLFCLGTVAKERGWRLWESRWSRPAGLAVLLLFAWIPTVNNRPQDNPLFGRNSQIWHYEGNLDDLNDVTGTGFGGCCLKTLVRLAVPLVHAFCIWGCLHVMPRREWRIITSFGSRSLANYIFHPLSGLLFSYLGLYGPNDGIWDMKRAPAWAEAAIVPLIVLTSLFWMSPWVWKLLWPILDPPIHWILKPVGEEVQSTWCACRLNLRCLLRTKACDAS